MRASRGALALALACATGMPAGAQARWSLVETLRIGSEADGPYLFSAIRGVAVGAEGSIFVLDFRAQEIRLFDAQGRFLRRVARKGSGPGEIQNANGLLSAPDGRVWVNDPGNGRFTVFTAAGDFATQYLATPWGYGYVWQGMFDRTGTLNEFFWISVPGRREPAARIRRVRGDGSRVDTIPLPECEERSLRGEDAVYVARTANASMTFGVPFVARPVRAWDGTGHIWCSSGDRYEVLKIRLVSGDTVVRVVGATSPVPVTAAEREAAIEPIRRAFGRIGQPPPDFGRIPRMKPAIESLDVDDAGRLWVRAPQSDSTRTVFDVWDGTGQRLATVVAPWRIGQAWHPLIRGDTLYTVVVDENEVPVVIRADIRR